MTRRHSKTDGSERVVSGTDSRSDLVDESLSSVRHEFVFYAPEPYTDSIFQVLQHKLPHIAAESWPQRAALGGVYLNGVRQTENTSVPFPSKIEYFEPKFSLEALESFFPPLKKEHVIYEDGDLVAVFKPAGLPSMPTREQQLFDLRTCAEKLFGMPIHFPSRLDTAVCGIVLGSQAKRSNRAVQHAFEFRAIRKDYYAEVADRPRWRWLSCFARIDRTPEHPVLRRITETGQDARSTFRVLKKKQPDGAALIESHPFTGRTHQLRIHLSYLGAPIIGDPFYGPMENAPLDSRAPLHLMAYRLQFTHPRTQKRMNLKVPDALLPEWVKKYGVGGG